MSYQEKTVTVSLFSYLMIWGYYLWNVFQMVQSGGLVQEQVFRLWGIVILMAIIVNIAAHILTSIVFNIIHMIRTNKEEPTLEDERDQLIGLKGTRITYIVFSIGVLLAMLTLVMDMPPLVMFNMLIFSSVTAEIVGSISQLYMYRRGF